MPTKPESLVGLKILVVEDETLIAEEIRERLTRLGLEVVEVVDTGAKAIQAAEQFKPQFILMDIRLKGPMDGIQAADVIRHRIQAPLLFLTAHSDQETLRRAKGTEPFGYVLKPFHERDLIVAIDMALYRHGLEQKLKESEKRYAATLASIGDGVIATDPEGRITFMNPVAEALTQWRLAEARGQHVDHVFPVLLEPTRAARENPARQALRLHQVVKLTEPAIIVSRNQDIIPIDDSAAPIVDDTGMLLGAVVAFRDVRQRRLTEDALKRAEEQLRQAQKMEAIGQLAGGVAHDFNNLLTVINGFSEILLQGDSLDATSRELVGEIKNAGERAAGLTKRLLAFSRKQVLQPSNVHLGILTADITRLLERVIGEDVVMSISSAHDLWLIWADPSQIEQVVMNLVVNGRDAMPQGGRLTIETQNVELNEPLISTRPEIQLGRYVVLSVSDTGTGMDAATQERIFEPFFTTKDTGKGTGLGLATVYGIVKQSEGYIYVYSEVGKGTTFKLYFPALAKTESIAARSASPATCGGNESVLLVEDDDSVRILVSTALRNKGYTIYEAKSGKEALGVFSKHREAIELVATDVVMPGMSGRELAEQLREIRPDLRILFMSGYTDDAVVRHGVLHGDVPFLQKPFTLNAISQKVREVLDS